MNQTASSPPLRRGDPAPAPDAHTLVSAFLENVPDRVYFKDRDSRFIAVSKSTAQWHGFETSDLVGKTDFDLFAEAHARPAVEDEQRIMRTGEAVIGKVEKETWPDGRVTWALSSKLPLRNLKGEIIGTFGLSKDITQTKEMELALEEAQKKLILASHQAGMAEVATGVLHNVGNVLNSVKVSTEIVAAGLRQSKADSLSKLGVLLREHAADLGEFLTRDPKGRLVPEFIESLAAHFASERARLLKEIEALKKHVDHISEIVAMQQAYATMAGILEPLPAVTLMEDSLRMNSGALVRHDVRIVRDFKSVPPVLAERGKVLQILVNLIRNAKYACEERGDSDKVMTLRVEPASPDRVRFVVQDNGVGISPENITRIFAHGFTTRVGGHGFGLHSSALAAREMKGALIANSDGPGKGAIFILELPIAPAGATAPAIVQRSSTGSA